MIRVISLDMDGTLVDSRFVDKVWMEGVPRLFSESHGVGLDDAKKFVVGEYEKIGSGRLEWYDLKYWIDRFGLDASREDLLEVYEGEIRIYPEVEEALEMLSGDYELVVTSNAAREFIEVELERIYHYFSEIFSATSDFKQVKKSPLVYEEVCKRMGKKPIEVMHIGDHYTYDYESPIEAGLDALFLDREGKRSGMEVVGDLREAVEAICGCGIPSVPCPSPEGDEFEDHEEQDGCWEYEEEHEAHSCPGCHIHR